MVTTPEGVTRASIFNVTPVFTLEMELANSEFPPDWTPVTACAESVGTSVPTLMLAGILSVAITEGAERTLARLSDSCNWTAAKSRRLLPTRADPERLVTPSPKPARKLWAVLGDALAVLCEFAGALPVIC